MKTKKKKSNWIKFIVFLVIIFLVLMISSIALFINYKANKVNKSLSYNETGELSYLVCLNKNDIIKDNPLGDNFMLEENGVNISGGQRQRIILARSLLKDGEVYIFDEALSQIDIGRERKILENIFSYLRDKTIIVISHRFDNKDLFSRVLTIKEGIIYEEDI